VFLLRDLFYSFRHLFSSQRESDEALKLATAILQVPRHHLHVVSSARGLAMGEVRFSVDQQSRRSFSEQMTLIEPRQAAAMSDFWCDVDFILVVEKETVFYRLANSSFPRRARCFLMTGKGYPDLATRQFLFRLIQEFPELPVLCLVDADPHGLEIYLTYKYGSRAAAAEPDCTAPSLQWIGLSVDDMLDLGLPQSLMQALSAQDVSKLASMRSRTDILPFEPAIASQLEQLHQLTMKAEIEILYTLGDDGVEQYVAAHFQGIMEEIEDNLRFQH
jgi:meiotic recombination protein SPO11